MVWVMDLSGRKMWAQAAVDALRATGLTVEEVTAPPSEPVVGLVLTAGLSTALCETLGAVDPDRHRVMVIGPPEGTLDPWPVLAAGASECVIWHGQMTPISSWIHRAEEVEAILDSPTVRSQVVGTSRALRAALRDLVVAARYGRAPILVLGETGTGKELAARVAHAVSTQRGNLVIVDCTTIVPALLGSELFGHERGAFTGAVSVRTGACSAADHGSLFLDEVGELPIDLQSGLLRLVQEGTYKRVGGDRWLQSRFRLICATNRDLNAEVMGNRFRADLYHRIAASVVTMPPLCDRREDVLCLFSSFCQEALGSREPPQLDPAVQDLLERRRYPGNLRDLRQLAARVIARHVGAGPITPGDVPVQDRLITLTSPSTAVCTGTAISDETSLRHGVAGAVDQGLSLGEIKERAGDMAMEVALERCGGNLGGAASMLGVTNRALQLRQGRRSADAAPAAQDSFTSSSASSRQ